MKSFDELIDESAGIIDAKETKDEETVSFDITSRPWLNTASVSSLIKLLSTMVDQYFLA